MVRGCPDTNELRDILPAGYDHKDPTLRPDDAAGEEGKGHTSLALFFDAAGERVWRLLEGGSEK